MSLVTIESLKALQKRIRECTGPDRDLDHAILETLLPRTRTNILFYGSLFTTYPDGLGACVALMAAVLPGWSWQVGAYPQVHAHVAEPVMTKYGPGIGVRAQTSGATVSLAFLDAIMSAVIAEEEQEKVNV